MGGFLGFGNHTQNGAGIPKDNSDKSRIKLFFEIFFRRFWKLIELNVLYVIFCIPIITIGPATAGMTKVLRNFSMERHAYIWTDFFESFKKNFKQSFFVGIADIIALTEIITGCWLYPKIASETGSNSWYILFSLTLSVGIIFIIMNFYIYLMIVSTDISMKAIIKNAFFLSCIDLKKNLLTLVIFTVIVAAAIILAIYYQIFLMLMLFFPAAILGLIVCFNCYPTVQKYVINPYYEKRGEVNPETEYNKPATAEESVFVDNTSGTKSKSDNRKDEKPVKIKKSKKNRTVS